MDIFLGIDVGSTTTKAVVIDTSLRRVGHAIQLTAAHGPQAAAAARDAALSMAGTTRVARCVATGYGRARVDFADRTVTEITCHARGVHRMHPQARTVLDIGGQDAKAIRLAADGTVDDFTMNDKCAAGTGSFLDMLVRRFEIPFARLSALRDESPRPAPISATCVVFAESEVVGLLAEGRSIADVAAGVHAAIARRVASMLEQIRAVGPVAMTGGVAQNASLLRDIADAAGLEIFQADEPQLAGAYGAALMAAEGPAPVR